MTFCKSCFGLAAVAWVGVKHHGLASAAVGVKAGYDLSEATGSVYDPTESDGALRTESWRSFKGLRGQDIASTYGGAGSEFILAEGYNTELIPVEYATELTHPEKREDSKVQENEAPDVVTPPLRGIKTFIFGALLLFFMLFIFASSEEFNLGKDPRSKFHRVLGEKLVDALADLDDVMIKQMPGIPFALLATSLLLSLGTALMFSGILQLGFTLRDRFKSNDTRVTSRMLGFVITPIALSIVLAFALLLTVDDYGDDSDQDFAHDESLIMGSAAKYGMAVNLFTGLLGLVFIGEAIQKWRKRHLTLAQNARAGANKHVTYETSKFYNEYPSGTKR